MKVYALIVAAGSSERFNGAVPKQFKEVCGRPLLSWTISRFEAAEKIDRIVVVVAEEYLLYTSERVIDPFDFPKVTKIVVGGQTRRESVLKGLEALPISTEYVAIHDGARPLVSPADIDRAVEVAISERATMLAARATDTVKRAREGYVLSTLERDSLYLAQTPQVFQYDLIMAAHKEAADSDKANRFTDDAAMVEARGFKVKIVEPTGPNIKVTTRDDLILVEALLTKELDEKP
jgi:2-C-methyl-D-erythritol 4-phosphate cytidylyltransferase